MKRIDNHCGLLAFKFPAVITLKGLSDNWERSPTIASFAFYWNISAVCKHTK